MKANENRWFWILIIVLAILSSIMKQYFKYSDFIALLIILNSLNATDELRQDFKRNIGKNTENSILHFL
ncbi:MAG: hypothetical protein Q8935_21625 [Bacillota bacterium]|nr:hypothetical protein [Bacillota bacterium]